jgi:hypothetical protein
MCLDAPYSQALGPIQLHFLRLCNQALLLITGPTDNKTKLDLASRKAITFELNFCCFISQNILYFGLVQKISVELN